MAASNETLEHVASIVVRHMHGKQPAINMVSEIVADVSGNQSFQQSMIALLRVLKEVEDNG